MGTALLGLGVALAAGEARAVSCTTQAELKPDERRSILETGNALAGDISAQNYDALQGSLLPAVIGDWEGMKSVAQSAKPLLDGGKVDWGNAYLLDATDLKGPADTQFFCTNADSSVTVTINLRSLPPGRQRARRASPPEHRPEARSAHHPPSRPDPDSRDGDCVRSANAAGAALDRLRPSDDVPRVKVGHRVIDRVREVFLHRLRQMPQCERLIRRWRRRRTLDGDRPRLDNFLRCDKAVVIRLHLEPEGVSRIEQAAKHRGSLRRDRLFPGQDRVKDRQGDAQKPRYFAIAPACGGHVHFIEKISRMGRGVHNV